LPEGTGESAKNLCSSYELVIARSMNAGAAPPSPESNEGELRKQGANNPGADTNPPEDQQDAVERVEVA